MPAVAPFIAAGIGLTGAAAVVGEAVIGIGLSVGAAYLARRLAPKSSGDAAAASQGTRLSLSVVANPPRELAFGLCASAGHLVYHNSYGPNGNDYVQLVFKLADEPCTSLEGMLVNGKAVTLGSSVTGQAANGQTVAEYPNVMRVEFHSGAWTQGADADLINNATGPAWPSTYRGRGVCYVRVTLKYDADKYKDGRPGFIFIFKGGKRYDWRKDSTNGGSGAHRWGDETTYEWTDNTAVCLYNFARGVAVNNKPLAGMNAPATALPVATWSAAANACYEDVALKGGGTEKRYRFNGIVSCDAQNGAVVKDMVASMGGMLIDSGGVFKPLAGVAQSVVATVTDGDIIATDEVRFIPKLSRAALVNAVFGSYVSPSDNYESTALPPRISPSDQTADGGVQLSENYGLGYVWSQSQGQRILEILRRKGRYQRRVSLKLRSRFAVLEAGDWVTWTSARYGFTSMTFEVQQAILNRDLSVSVELKETASGIYAWTAATDELDPNNPAQVGSGGAKFTTIAGLTAQTVTVTSGGVGSRPAILITWTPVTDQTVTGIEIAFRKVGDTAEYSAGPVLVPSDGSYTWSNQVQGGTAYEVRVRPIVQPIRAVTWTGWTATATNTPPQVVDVASSATSVPPDTITPAMLSAQARFELALITERDTVLGSLAQAVADATASAELAHSATINALLDGVDARAQIGVEKRLREDEDRALAEQITTAVANINANAAIVQQQISALATQTGAVATSLEAVTTRVDDQEATAFDLSQSVDGIKARKVIGVMANGRSAVIDVGGNEFGNQIVFVSDEFAFAHDDVAGGSPVPMLAIKSINGINKFVFNGEMLTDAITSGEASFASLKAISSNFGDMTCSGYQRSANGKMVIDWSNNRMWIDA